MGVLDKVVSILRPSATLPVMQIVAACDELKGVGYRSEIEKALAYYRGSAQVYVAQNLAAVFPKSAKRMMPVTFALVPRVVKEQARVFGQIGERWESETKTDDLKDFLAISQLVQRLKEVDRLAIIARSDFVRVRFDPSTQGLELRIFTPERVSLSMTGDSTGIGDDVVFEVASIPTPTGKLRRLEWWRRDSTGAGTVTIVDEKGVVIVPPQPLAYKDDKGVGVLPIVRFSSVGLDDGFWPLPNQNLISAAQAIDAQATNSNYVASLSGYPQFVSEDTVPGTSADWKQKKIETGPETVMVPPKGARITSITRTADVVGYTLWRRAFIADVEASESIPPGAILNEGRSASSGAALTIERAPLTELRIDHAEAYRPSVERLLEVMRLVWNAHRPDAVIKGPLRWTEGDMTAPMGPQERAQADSTEIANGTSSPVRVLMRERGVTREEAIVLAGEIALENRERTAGMLDDAGSKVFPKDDAADEPDAKEPPPVTDVGLNGAQITAAQGIVEAMAAGQLPRESAQALIEQLGIEPATVQKILGPTGFRPAAPE